MQRTADALAVYRLLVLSSFHSWPRRAYRLSLTSVVRHIFELGFECVYSTRRGLEVSAKPVSIGASFPQGTFQTIHIAVERSEFMQSSFRFVGRGFDVAYAPVKEHTHGEPAASGNAAPFPVCFDSDAERGAASLSLVFGGGAGAFRDPRRQTSMKTRMAASALLLILAGFWSVSAGITKLPAERKNALQDPSHFRQVNGVTNLPPVVLALCADANGRLAAPDQAWQATDVIQDDKLPRKRLVWAATDGEYWVVYYERGGRGHSYHVAVVQLRHGDAKPSFVWRGVGERLKDFPAFLAAVRSNKLDDTLDYAH